MGDVVKLHDTADVAEQVPPAGVEPVALAEVAARSIAAMDVASKDMVAEARTTAAHRLEESRERVILHKRIGAVEREMRGQRWGMLALAIAFVVDAFARVFG